MKTVAHSFCSQPGPLDGLALTSAVALIALLWEALVDYLTLGIRSDLSISLSKLCVIKLLEFVSPDWTEEPLQGEGFVEVIKLIRSLAVKESDLRNLL